MTRLARHDERKDWHPEDVRAAIRKSGVTMAGLSKIIGFSESAVRRTLRHPWSRVEALIAEHLGHNPTDIWPSRYDAAGQPLRPREVRRRRTQATGQPVSAHRKTGAAA